MAEVKRPKLISFGCERVNAKNTKEISKTVRISVVLSDSTEDSFPEFNYLDELLAVKKKSDKNPPIQTNGLDPFNEDDEDVKRIAAQMEAKYGMGVSKKKKFRKDDFADIGMGYDESDSFIDNTDGYDEIIPKNVTTVHGGFYINSGALEFKTDEIASSDDSSSSENETAEKSPNRKRLLESSAASEDETPYSEKSELPEKKQRLIQIQNGMQKAIKKRLFGHDKIKQIRKKRNSESKRTVRDLLKERRVDLNMTISEYIDTPEKNDTILSFNENKKSPDSVDNVIESVINAVVKQKEDKFEDLIKETSQENVSKDIVNNLAVNHSSEAESSDGIAIKSPLEYVQLPENIPNDIIEIIDSMKNAAASSTEGKVKFFTGNVNVLLLSLERKCKCLGRRSRNKVYEHLAPFVKCRKETLMKRAKNLVVIEDKRRIKSLIDKLKEAVGVTMPTILSNYEEECKLILQKKFSADEETNKNLRMPKRHFPWDEDTKKLLRDIVTLRKKCFLNEGKQKDSVELNLITFIKSEMQIIWPEGWMSMNTLMKYSNLAKDKKAIVSSMKSSSSTSLHVKDSPPISTSHISISPNSGLTITPVAASINKNSFLEVNSISSVTPSETIITRISSDNSNTSKSSIVLPLTPPDTKIFKTEQTNISYNSSLTNLISNIEETPIQDLVLNEVVQEDHSKMKDDDIQSEVVVETEIKIEESEIENEENLAAKVDLPYTNVIKQETPVIVSSPVNVIDLTDLPELVRKPGPKSKTKYYPDYLDNGTKMRKESSNLSDELSGTSALNKIITDSLSLELNNVTHRTTHHTGSNNSYSNSVLKNHAYDYSKAKTFTNDYSKLKSSTNDLSKMKCSTNDLSRIKLHAKDLSKLKPSANDFSKIQSTNDFSKIKSSVNDLAKIKSSINDFSKLKSSISDVSKVKSSTNDFSKLKTSTNDLSKIRSSDYSRTKSVTEGDDNIKMAMESLMVLQKMASPVKSQDESRSSSAVSVINFNKGYSHDSRHGLSSSLSPTTNNVPHRNSSFQDAFQKQFIPDFISMKASQTSPSNRNCNSLPNPKFNHTSHKSNSALGDRYLQNSNHIYPQQNPNNKLKSVSSSSQSVGSYSLLDDMYTNFLNEYNHSKAANSKSSTHPK